MSPSDNSDSDISVDDETPSERQSKRRRNERDDSVETDAAATAKKPVPRQPAVQLWRYPKREGFSIDSGDDDDSDEADDDPDFNIHEAKKNDGDLFYSPSDDEDDAYQNHLKLRSRLQKSKNKKIPKRSAASQEGFNLCLEYNDSAVTVYHDDDNSVSINADAEVAVQRNPHAAVAKPKKARKSRKKSAANAAILPPVGNSTSLSSSNDTEPSTMTREQRSDAIAEYFKAYKIAKAEKSDDECRFHTVRELVRQGYNRTTVESIVDRLLANNMTLPLPRRTKPSPHATPLHVLTDIRDKFHEYVQMVAEGDLSKVSVRQFARSIGVHLRLVERALHDDELKQRLRQRKADNEVIYEARRSLIVAKFIDFTGNVRERRNACMRYFCRTPNYSKKTILNACNRFLAYGTVRSHEKNKATVWAGSDLINNRKCEVVTQEEADYLKALNAEHSWLACNLNLNSVQKRPQVLEPTSAKTMTSDSSGDNNSNNNGRDIVAALTARNEALERELKDSKMHSEQLQQQLYEVHRPVMNAEQ